MLSRYCLALGFALSAAPFAAPAAAQDASIAACETQQELEQVIQSDGDLMPDGCRMLSLTRVEADVGDLCVLDFEAVDPGVLDTLRDAAMPTQWWIECADLTAP